MIVLSATVCTPPQHVHVYFTLSAVSVKKYSIYSMTYDHHIVQNYIAPYTHILC